MFEGILTDIICKTFEKEVGRWQIKAEEKSEKQFGLLVSFSLTCDYDKESGYRFLDIMIYGPANYVGVMVRERWNIIPLNELDFDEEQGEDFIKEGCNYRDGGTEWKLAAYHDSCWRDGVRRSIYDNREKINTLSGPFETWYEKVEMTPELLEIFSNATSDRSGSFYKAGEGVLRF